MEKKINNNLDTSDIKQPHATTKVRQKWRQKIGGYMKAKTGKMKAQIRKLRINEQDVSGNDLSARITARATELMALFTLIMAIVGVLTLYVLKNQLKEMRIDQRAWLEFRVQPDTQTENSASWKITAGQPINYPLMVVNIGKTAARNIAVFSYVDIIDSTLEPPLDHVEGNFHIPHNYMIAGVAFPNEPLTQLATRYQKGGVPLMATKEEVRAFSEGRAYLAVYGIISYYDVYNTHHWTRFCRWIGGVGAYNTQTCTQYNNVDNNN